MMNQYENEYDDEVCECWEELSDSVEDDGDYDGDSGNLEYDSRTLLPEHTTTFTYLGNDDELMDDELMDDELMDDEHKTPTQLLPLPGQREQMKKQHESEQLWQAEFAKQHESEREVLALMEAEARLAMEKEREQKLHLMQLEEAHIFWNMTYQFEISTGADERDACARAGETMMKFTDSLPTESPGARQKRIDEDKDKIKAAKERRIRQAQPLKFPHRRNGGGKGKVFQPPNEEVMAARRALKRRQRKEQNRVEEAQREAQFAAAPPVAPVEEEYLKKFNEELTEEEIEARREEQKYIWDVVTAKLSHDVSQDDFPDLSKVEAKAKAKAPKVVKENEWTPVGKATKSKAMDLPKVIKMGAAPYRTPWTPSAPVAQPDTVREKAFEKLADAQGQGGQSLSRTKMCMSVTKGVPCRHGDRCRFAHSQEELQIAKCFFGCNCRFVRQTNQGWWVNAGGDKKCTFIHEGESKENYVKRVGIPTGSQDSTPLATPLATPKSTPMATPKQSRVPSPSLGLPKTAVWAKPVPLKAEVVEEEVCEEVCEEVVVEEVKPPTSNKKICESVLKGIPCRHADRCRFLHPHALPKEEPPKEEPPKEEVEETVLRVPMALAMQAMEMALKAGMKNVRVEIV